MLAWIAMTERTKPVWVSARTRRELLRRAGELQAKTEEKVSIEKMIEVALRLLDTEAAAKLIRSGDTGWGSRQVNESDT
jgi:hypothetical protein